MATPRGEFRSQSSRAFRNTKGDLIRVRRQHLAETTVSIGSDGGLALNVEHGALRRTRFEGVHARRAAAVLFPAVNRKGGSADDIGAAVERLARAGSAEQFLGDVVRRSSRLTRGEKRSIDEIRYDIRFRAKEDTGLLALPTSLSLAIEMALHEEQERQALEGELAELEEAWREAEEIGAIADDMFLPSTIEQALVRLRLR